jgi:hypothetical protein
LLTRVLSSGHELPALLAQGVGQGVQARLLSLVELEPLAQALDHAGLHGDQVLLAHRAVAPAMVVVPRPRGEPAEQGAGTEQADQGAFDPGLHGVSFSGPGPARWGDRASMVGVPPPGVLSAP